MSAYGNLERMIEISQQSWRRATEQGLTLIRTRERIGNRLRTVEGHEFLNMVSCSYLGLNRDPRIARGAVEGIEEEGTMSISCSRARIAPVLVEEVEALLGRIYRADALVTASCFTASAAVLPLLASGHLTGGRKPVMIFDQQAHFSMKTQRAICGNETQILSCDHNDLEHIEAVCREHPVVAYVGDGAYSMGGNAPIAELRALQERYGLFLYLDDSHSLSIHGERGEGLVRSQLGAELNDRTIVVGSLAKAFGATGGVILLGTPLQRELLSFSGGPLGWSQMENAAGLGAIRASARIHLSPELAELQEKLRRTLERLDELIPTANAGDGLPIRVIPIPGVEAALDAAARLYRRGYYTSAVFFPIVARGGEGLRVMGRADISPADIEGLARALAEPV